MRGPDLAGTKGTEQERSAGRAGLRFELALPAEREAIAAWIASETWPFHVNPAPTFEDVLGWFDEGAFASPGASTFWIRDAEATMGLVRLMDLDDDTPLFDLRLASRHRGQGLGEQALAWLVAHVFGHYPEVRRIEGTTREDNVRMRRLFGKLGFVKEAHYRAAWPVGTTGSYLATIGYGLLRQDWEGGQVTPLVWDDEPPHALRPG